MNIEELIKKYNHIFSNSKPDMLDDAFSRGEDAGSGRVSHEIVVDLKQLKQSLAKDAEDQREVLAKATEYDKLDHKFKLVCGKRVDQVLQHLCLFGFGDGITEQQALNKLAERFPMTTDQIVSILEMSQTGVNHKSVEVPEFVAEYLKKAKNDPYPTLASALETAKYNYKMATWLEHYKDLDDIDSYDKAFKNQEVFARAWFDGYTVAKEPLYFWILNLQSTILYQFAIKRGSSYILKSGFPIAECAMTEKTAKEILRKDFDLFKPVEPKLSDGTIIDAVPVEEEE